VVLNLNAFRVHQVSGGPGVRQFSRRGVTAIDDCATDAIAAA
jgi:hypothetical protein